ncbi:hypothetical protein GCM10018781_00190 [Kitasatospora indigofera]|uniref:Uncharacterized protein n=1 Tax=Kitasatospora indigofera TaxID=67307 RepID=A0A919FAH9_9ACTN|nr:hypothetical protein [Kitasatospora indigofera]GHH58576.1 hypothetical protein GCM10018781_00190 [Kitasatospora indigofera]
MADPDAGTTGVAPSALDKAALALDSIATESTAAGKTADDSTGAAASKLSGWDTANSLRAALTEWHEQVSTLNTRLNQEAGMMRQTHTNYVGIDSVLAQSFGGR